MDSDSFTATFAEEILACSICFGTFRDPRGLPCYHTFCYPCIREHADNTRSDQGTFLCPLCRCVVAIPESGLGDLKRNFALQKAGELLAINERKRRASETSGTESDKTKEEVPLHVKHSHSLPNMCSLHANQELKYYCVDNSQIVCGDCIVTGHRKHECVPLAEIAAQRRDKLHGLAEQSLEKLHALERAIQDTKVDMKSEEQYAEDMIQQIEKHAKQLHAVLDQCRDSLVAKTKKILAQRLKQHEAHRSSLELKHACLESARSFAQSLLSDGSDTSTMQHSDPLNKRLSGLRKSSVQHAIPRKPSYNLGKISPDRIQEMMGTVTDKGGVFIPETPIGLVLATPSGPAFLEKAKLVHSFSARLQSDAWQSRRWFSGLAINDTRMYVVDILNSSTKAFSHAGDFLFQMPVKEPRDVAIGQDETLFVSSMHTKCVSVFSPAGKPISTIGKGLFTSHFRQPFGITFDGKGNIMVCDRTRRDITLFHAERGRHMATIPLRMCKEPQYITINQHSGEIIVSDREYHLIYSLSFSGEIIFKYGGKGQSGGELNGPRGVCTDRYGHIFVSNMGNDTILMLSPQGKFMRYVVTEGIKQPTALAVDPQGRLVVVESQGDVKTFQYLV